MLGVREAVFSVGMYILAGVLGAPFCCLLSPIFLGIKIEGFLFAPWGIAFVEFARLLLLKYYFIVFFSFPLLSRGNLSSGLWGLHLAHASLACRLSEHGLAVLGSLHAWPRASRYDSLAGRMHSSGSSRRCRKLIV